MKIFIISLIFVISATGTILPQSDLTTDSKLYSNGIPASTSFGLMPGEVEINGNNNPPFSPDWMGTDVTIYSGTTFNITERDIDLKLGKDGNMYLAMCVNNSDFHGIRCYRSTNSGLNWSLVKALSGTSSVYYTGLSMLVERNHPSNNDSTRVLIFFTYSPTNSLNDDAFLRFYSFLGNGSGSGISVNISYPHSGREYRWPSAVSNGAFVSMLPHIGVVLTEHTNDGTFFQFKYFLMIGLNYASWIEYSKDLSSADLYWPSASFRYYNGEQKVCITAERRYTNNSQIALYIIDFINPPGAWPYTEVTSNTSYYYAEPCITIPQNYNNCNQMLISYLRKTSSLSSIGQPQYSFLQSGGVWIDYSLSNSFSSAYTWITSDSNRSTNDYCLAIFGDTDSLNAKRGGPTNLGTQSTDLASNYITNSTTPVCAIYKNGNLKRSAFTYWGSQVLSATGVYFDSQNLPTNVKNTEGSVYSYELSQNYPNPFNPVTYINYSIPKPDFVKLSVFDILGKEVATLVNSNKPEGSYQVSFDASKLSSGVYFYKITAGEYIEVKKMSVIK
jgi:hypothetical protein